MMKIERYRCATLTHPTALNALNASLQSWLGHARHADTQGLRTKILAEICFAKQDHT